MKHLKFFAAACCMAAVFASCEKNDVESASGTENGHAYVDLGLPSGTKWATCNVGANNPEEYGDYFAWGETEPKTTYNDSTYTWAAATYDAEYDCWDFKLTKYCTDSDYGKDGFADYKTVLDPEDDAARANWGGKWRMPTWAEWTELCNNCAWKRTDNYNGTGVAGNVVTGFNGNSIFLPAAGNRYDDYLDYAGNYGGYWSTSLNPDEPDEPDCAWGVYFDSDFVGRLYFERSCGSPVRPVFK